jgi:hypothetical protein
MKLPIGDWSGRRMNSLSSAHEERICVKDHVSCILRDGLESKKLI